jgi:inner membrane transporter RhtA
VGPAGAVTLRLVLAAAVLGVVSAVGRRSGRRVRWSWADAAVVMGFGMALAAMNAAFYEAIARIPLGVAVTVEFCGPLGLALALSRRRADVAWALAAAAGVFLLASGELLGTLRHLDPGGVGLALLAGVLWAAYILFSRETGRRFPGTSGLAAAMAVAALAVLPAGLAVAGSALLAPGVVALGAAVAVLSSVVPYSFELLALRRVPPRAFGILLSVEPAVAALAGLAILGQRLSGVEVGALFLVVVANLGSALSDVRRVGGTVPEAAGLSAPSPPEARGGTARRRCAR